MGATVGRVDVRIVGVNLPGRSWAGYDGIHVGVQRRDQPVELVPGDAPEAVWDIDVGVLPDGDFRGPFVQGKRGERFVYLCWVAVDAAGGLTRFGRVKLMLGAVDANVVAAAGEPGRRLLATLALTDARGGPRYAAVRPPAISWTVAP